MKTFFVVMLPLGKIVLWVLLQYFNFDNCSVETLQPIEQSFSTIAMQSHISKNQGQYVMHHSCITYLSKIPLQIQ